MLEYLATIAGGVAATLLSAWLLMMLMGAAHIQEGLEWIPPVGFHGAVLIAVTVNVLGLLARSSANTD